MSRFNGKLSTVDSNIIKNKHSECVCLQILPGYGINLTLNMILALLLSFIAYGPIYYHLYLYRINVWITKYLCFKLLNHVYNIILESNVLEMLKLQFNLKGHYV